MMNKLVFALGAVFTICVPQTALAEAVTPKTSAVVTFTGRIDPQTLVNRFCVVVAETDGVLKPNDDYTMLSSFGADGSRPGQIKVSYGNFDINLTATKETLTRENTDQDGTKSDVSVQNVALKSGIGSSPENNSSVLQRNADNQVKVWFEAKLSEAGSTFEPGVYTGQTTITCEPGLMESSNDPVLVEDESGNE